MGKMWNPPSAHALSAHTSSDPPLPLDALPAPSGHARRSSLSISASNDSHRRQTGNGWNRSTTLRDGPEPLNWESHGTYAQLQVGNLWDPSAPAPGFRTLPRDWVKRGARPSARLCFGKGSRSISTSAIACCLDMGVFLSINGTAARACRTGSIAIERGTWGTFAGAWRDRVGERGGRDRET